jgi:hypothetical protein
MCKWCMLGAYENNDSPFATKDPDFDSGKLEAWRASGERLKESIDALCESYPYGSPDDHDDLNVDHND